jgi:hypothetical protein
MIVNDCLLVLLLLGSYRWMQHLSRPAALLFVGWYGAFYLASGPSSLMQRDWLAMLPMVTAFAMMANSRDRLGHARIGTAFVVGSLIGISACFKPHLSLGGVPVVIGLGLLNEPSGLQLRSDSIRRFAFRVALPAMLGFAIPLVAVVLWLAYRDALGSFASMVHDYLPLHIQQLEEHQFLKPLERLRYVLVHAPLLGRFWPMMLVAVVAFVLIDRQLAREPRSQTLFRLAFATLAIYALEPALSGQFWEYHYFPFQYWLLAILSLLAIPILSEARKVAIPGVLLFACIGFSFWRHHVTHAGPAEHGAVADMVQSLKKNVPAGAPVQPLDWSTGAVQALLRTEHPIGTRFLYDYHFYHHVQTPTIQKLRAEFVAEMVACRVPYVLEVRRRFKDVMSGVGTSDHFDALDRLLDERYESVHEGKIYRLLRLKQLDATLPAAIHNLGDPCSTDHRSYVRPRATTY